MKVIYNVTVNIDHEVHNDWFEWMRQEHIPEVLGTGMFIDARFSKILAEESGGLTYSIQYLCHDMEHYQKYQAEFAPSLQNKHNQKYGGKFVAFRTVLRVEDILIP